MVPSWYWFALMALAAFRLWKLLGNDKILDRPRRRFKRFFGRVDGYLDLFISCPWCLGAWCCLAVYSGWIAFGPGVFSWSELYLAGVVVFALSAVVGWLGTLLPDDPH